MWDVLGSGMLSAAVPPPALPHQGLPASILGWEHRFGSASMTCGDLPAQPIGMGPSAVEKEGEIHVV